MGKLGELQQIRPKGGGTTYHRATRSQLQELHFLGVNSGYVQVEDMNGAFEGQHGDCADGQM
jgi:hypothetical protein